MGRLREICDFFFPTITPFSADELEKMKNVESDDLERITNTHWGKNNDLALTEIEKIISYEQNRKKTAETKASTYLAVVVALIPVTLSIISTDWAKNFSSVPEVLRLSFLFLAVLYTGAAGWFAVAALKISGFQTVATSDLTSIWSKRSYISKLLKLKLQSVRCSQDKINRKITYVILIEKHLVRSAFFFLLLLVSEPIFAFFKFLVQHIACAITFLKFEVTMNSIF